MKETILTAVEEFRSLLKSIDSLSDMEQSLVFVPDEDDKEVYSALETAKAATMGQFRNSLMLFENMIRYGKEVDTCLSE